MSQGYYRFPTVFGKKIAFTSEDDLWEISTDDGIPRRLTAGLGTCVRPQYSPDGKWLAFSSAEEGHMEVFVMPADGGEFTRLTYLGAHSLVVGWRDPSTVLFSSTAFDGQRMPEICQVRVTGSLAEPLKLGPAVNLAFSPKGEVVLERNSHRPDPAHWKRYRGGTAGRLWYAKSLEAEFKPLLKLNSNFSRPLFVGDRIYFTSDHEGIGNLYSCTHQGEGLRRETDHKDYYARNPSTDGKTIVYHSGSDLYVFDVAKGETRKIDVDYRSQRTQRQRKFVYTQSYLDCAMLDPKGEHIALTSRGQVHHLRNWDGPVTTIKKSACRYRLAQYAQGGERIIAVTDQNGDEQISIYDLKTHTEEFLADPTWGRFTDLLASPKTDKIAFSNHRNELWLLDLITKQSRKISHNEHATQREFSWSPDGAWLAFSRSESWNRMCVCIANAETGEVQKVTDPLFEDFSPSFDPDGRYLYFLSKRELNPVYDGLHFELSFPKSIIPCLITLRKDIPSPFLAAAKSEDSKSDDKKEKCDEPAKLEIDFDGITRRMLAFPMPEGKYWRITGLSKKVLIVSNPVEGALHNDWYPKDPPAKALLEAYDFATLKSETIVKGISDYSLSHDRTHMLLRISNRLRVVKSGEKPEDSRESFNRKSGWIDIERGKTLIEPAAEWRQMLHEVWRLQRDHFWREDMSKINWQRALDRYLPLLDRVSCRSEFGDLVWELQGELGTSHAYDIGGDYRYEPHYPVGLLGADYSFDAKNTGYRVERLLQGDPWKVNESCPLSAPGVGVEVGDVITAINYQPLGLEMTPHRALLHLAGNQVDLTILKKNGDKHQTRVKALYQELNLRYRDWICKNEALVREKTQGRVGYIHIPDMGPRGFAEFHRHFLRDYNCDALIVDVRYNGGGHVSQLLLEKLCRKRLGADQSRWFGTFPFPEESPAGPMVAITNEYAGSDGDIFSHSFKMRKAGPLIGRRTWGGVIGIWPRHRLVDGGITTQPEFSHWFSDVGWQVENYGAEPDIDVDIAPHQYRRLEDPQLVRGLEEIAKLLEVTPPFRPELKDYPDLSFNG